MRLALAIVAIIVAAAFATTSAIDHTMIKYINSLGTTWTAGVNKFMIGKTVQDIKSLCTAKFSNEPVPTSMVRYGSSSDPAPEFNSLNQWPDCIHPIRDQQQCGSCWAFSGSEVLSDRFCIGSNNTINVVLSPQESVSCDTANFGCDGGYLDKTWAFYVKTGIVTDACYPYTSGNGQNGVCLTSCTNGAAWEPYYASNSYRVGNPIFTQDRPNQIANEIALNGPVQVGYTVYQDFMSYTSGVYQHVTGAALGGHAVKMLGWGVDNGTPYWICANSWGSDWGMNGYFWILKGVNECGIEAQVWTGLAKV